MSRMHYILWLGLWVLICSPAYPQSPYQLSVKKEAVLVGIGGSTLGISMYLKSKATLFTPEQLEHMDPAHVNPFDRVATRLYSRDAENASTMVLNISTALPLLFLADKNSRKDFSTIALLWGETVLINTGVTFLAKQISQRARPFVFNKEINIGRKLTTNSKTAFFSGHTSLAAANSFFAAKVFSDYYPESKWKPVVWTMAAGIPALTGYLRVQAGEHYPTDVIAGYAAGALIGYLVPHFHRNISRHDRTLHVYAGMTSVYVRMPL